MIQYHVIAQKANGDARSFHTRLHDPTDALRYVTNRGYAHVLKIVPRPFRRTQRAAQRLCTGCGRAI
jgi:hypothetical protein